MPSCMACLSPVWIVKNVSSPPSTNHSERMIFSTPLCFVFVWRAAVWSITSTCQLISFFSPFSHATSCFHVIRCYFSVCFLFLRSYGPVWVCTRLPSLKTSLPHPVAHPRPLYPSQSSALRPTGATWTALHLWAAPSVLQKAAPWPAAAPRSRGPPSSTYRTSAYVLSLTCSLWR